MVFPLVLSLTFFLTEYVSSDLAYVIILRGPPGVFNLNIQCHIVLQKSL
jgi:hypothetical protein